MGRWFLVPLTFSALAWPAAALAVDCSPPSGYSPCIDSDSLWLPAGAGRFTALESSDVPGAYQVGLSVTLEQTGPSLVLQVPSPDLGGRQTPLVQRGLEHAMALRLGLGAQWEVGATFATIVWQRGAGPSAITTQSGPALERSAPRDPRLSLARRAAVSRKLVLKPRLELTLPLGDSAAHASQGSAVVAPTLGAEWRHARLSLALELGLRFRPAVEFGTTRLGSQLTAGTGILVELFPERLWLTTELFALPSLVGTTSRRGRELGAQVRVLPAEGLFSVHTRPGANQPWTLLLAGGAGLRLSRESGELSSSWFVAPATPGWRALLAVRYAPNGA